MPKITQMFKPYLAELFNVGALFSDEGNSRMRVVLPLTQPVGGRQHAQPVLFAFDKRVIAEMSTAISTEQFSRQERIGEMVARVAASQLVHFDPMGSPDTDYHIHIGVRVLDL